MTNHETDRDDPSAATQSQTASSDSSSTSAGSHSTTTDSHSTTTGGRSAVTDSEQMRTAPGPESFEWAVTDEQAAETGAGADGRGDAGIDADGDAETDASGDADGDADGVTREAATPELGDCAGAWEPSGTTMLAMADERTRAEPPAERGTETEAKGLGTLWGELGGVDGSNGVETDHEGLCRGDGEKSDVVDAPRGDETDRETADAGASGWTRLVSAVEEADVGVDLASDFEVGSALEDGPEPVETTNAVDPERYLLAGEETVATCAVRRGWLVVTTHRVLAFDPGSDGQRFHAVDRLNVVDVGASGGGDDTVLGYAVRAALYSVLCLGGGMVARSLGLRSVFTVAPGTVDAPGVSGLTSMLSLASALVGLLVDGLLVVGLLAAVAAVGLGAYFLRERHPTLTVEVAGGDPLEVALAPSADPTATVEAVRDALEPELGL